MLMLVLVALAVAVQLDLTRRSAHELRIELDRGGAIVSPTWVDRLEVNLHATSLLIGLGLIWLMAWPTQPRDGLEPTLLTTLVSGSVLGAFLVGLTLAGGYAMLCYQVDPATSGLWFDRTECETRWLVGSIFGAAAGPIVALALRILAQPALESRG
jgi:hypothetical protein